MIKLKTNIVLTMISLIILSGCFPYEEPTGSALTAEHKIDDGYEIFVELQKPNASARIICHPDDYLEEVVRFDYWLIMSMDRYNKFERINIDGVPVNVRMSLLEYQFDLNIEHSKAFKEAIGSMNYSQDIYCYTTLFRPDRRLHLNIYDEGKMQEEEVYLKVEFDFDCHNMNGGDEWDCEWRDPYEPNKEMNEFDVMRDVAFRVEEEIISTLMEPTYLR